MSYLDFYTLTAPPFALTPDPAFWFETATHKRAMAYLGYGLQQGEGFIVVTGEVGAGKTTLVALLMERLDPVLFSVVNLVSTQVGGDDMLRLAAQGFGLPVEGAAKAQLLDRLERYLTDRAREGRKTLLIVDEAQALSQDALEELRMLSNFQSGGRALLQILLLGQPEFRDRLASPTLEQLSQRVIATHHLDGMEASEVGLYLDHRLAIVGGHGRPHFDDDACTGLYDATRGIPRRINQLATRALLQAAVERAETIDGAAVARVIADLDMSGGEAAPLTSTTGPAMPGDITARLALLERLVEDQDAALRRILNLMIDYVERDASGANAAPRVRQG